VANRVPWFPGVIDPQLVLPHGFEVLVAGFQSQRSHQAELREQSRRPDSPGPPGVRSKVSCKPRSMRRAPPNHNSSSEVSLGKRIGSVLPSLSFRLPG
jgi:hypothetical protein